MKRLRKYAPATSAIPPRSDGGARLQRLHELVLEVVEEKDQAGDPLPPLLVAEQAEEVPRLLPTRLVPLGVRVLRRLQPPREARLELQALLGAEGRRVQPTVVGGEEGRLNVQR